MITPRLAPNPRNTISKVLEARLLFEVMERFKSGDGVERNFEQAARWYRQAMARGSARGAFCLAQMYRHGEIQPPGRRGGVRGHEVCRRAR